MSLKKIIRELFVDVAFTVAPFLTNCGTDYVDCRDINDARQQYVAEDTADVRGTWYVHGRSGGWGPNDEWGFGWYYLKQFGTKIEGKQECEYYSQNSPFCGLVDIRGTITGNKILLTSEDYGLISWCSMEVAFPPLENNHFRLEGTVEGEVITGQNFRALERTCSCISRWLWRDEGN